MKIEEEKKGNREVEGSSDNRNKIKKMVEEEKENTRKIIKI